MSSSHIKSNILPSGDTSPTRGIVAGEGPSKALARVHRQWTTLGRHDPLWAILSEPDKKGGRWDLDAFLETGVREIGEVLERAQTLAPMRFGSAIDFGCGIGRLSQALAQRFDTTIGVDVAESMIAQANQVNRAPERCRYLHNLSSDLSILPDESADLVYSSITLQHVETPLARGYIREFFRVAAVGGHVIFQLPSRPRSMLWHTLKTMAPRELSNLLWRLRTSAPETMETYYMNEQQVAQVVRDSGGSLLSTDRNEDGPEGWESRRYFCIRERA